MAGADVNGWPIKTAKDAAAFAGCSVSTLRRYECGLCERSALRVLMKGCGAWGQDGPACDPLKKTWPPKRSKPIPDHDSPPEAA